MCIGRSAASWLSVRIFTTAGWKYVGNKRARNIALICEGNPPSAGPVREGYTPICHASIIDEDSFKVTFRRCANGLRHYHLSAHDVPMRRPLYPAKYARCSGRCVTYPRRHSSVFTVLENHCASWRSQLLVQRSAGAALIIRPRLLPPGCSPTSFAQRCTCL